MISAYADGIAARLSFDRELSARVRREVEDHLHEAAAEHGNVERAIERFGEPGAIAAQFASASVTAQAKKLSVTVLLVLGAAFLAMNMRLAWYDFTEWAVCENTAALGELLATLDRSAFLLAAATGLAGLLVHGRRRLFLYWMAAGLLTASVLCDGFLTAFRLAGWEWSIDFVVPLGSMALEAACAALLAFQLRRIAQRISAAAALL
jgi:hypothetical protein